MRVAGQSKSLFLRGKANAGTILLLDLLAAEPGSIFTQGFTFFIGDAAYRTDQQRFFPAHNRSLDQNMKKFDDLDFEVCRIIAAHNPLQNRRLVKNLWEASKLDGDRFFESSLQLSDEDYQAEMDKKYGAVRA